MSKEGAVETGAGDTHATLAHCFSLLSTLMAQQQLANMGGTGEPPVAAATPKATAASARTPEMMKKEPEAENVKMETQTPPSTPPPKAPVADPKPKVPAKPKPEDTTPKPAIRKVGVFRLEHGTLEIFGRFFPDEPMNPRPMPGPQSKEFREAASGSAAPKTPPTPPPQSLRPTPKVGVRGKDQTPKEESHDEHENEENEDEEPQLGAD